MKKLFFATTIMLGIAVTASAQTNDAKTTKVEDEKTAITKNQQAEIEKSKMNAEKAKKAKAKQAEAAKAVEIVADTPAAITTDRSEDKSGSASEASTEEPIVKEKAAAKKSPAKHKKSVIK